VSSALQVLEPTLPLQGSGGSILSPTLAWNLLWAYRYQTNKTQMPGHIDLLELSALTLLVTPLLRGFSALDPPRGKFESVSTRA
jgi:hypothetical protein